MWLSMSSPYQHRGPHTEVKGVRTSGEDQSGVNPDEGAVPAGRPPLETLRTFVEGSHRAHRGQAHLFPLSASGSTYRSICHKSCLQPGDLDRWGGQEAPGGPRRGIIGEAKGVGLLGL
jgi:hypothetical protein